MKIGQELVGLFENLECPDSCDGIGPSYATCPIADLEGVLIGKSSSGDACLLIVCEDGDLPRPPYDLNLVRVDWNRRVRYAHLGQITENRFTIIRAKDQDIEQIELFFYLFVSLLARLHKPLVSKSVMDTVERCVQLFQRSKSSASKSILGVWSELLLICLSDDVNVMVNAWHSSANEHYDFSLQGGLVEVKCTTGPTRSHRFSADQLKPPEGATCWIASVRTSSLTNGTTVQDLVEEATNRSGISVASIERILDVTLSALGEAWANSKTQSFDRAQALGTLQIYRSEDVPSIGPAPAGVSDIHFTANLEFANFAPSADFDSPLLKQLAGVV